MEVQSCGYKFSLLDLMVIVGIEDMMGWKGHTEHWPSTNYKL